MVNFWATIEKIGLLFIPTFGRTESASSLREEDCIGREKGKEIIFKFRNRNVRFYVFS